MKSPARLNKYEPTYFEKNVFEIKLILIFIAILLTVAIALTFTLPTYGYFVY